MKALLLFIPLTILGQFSLAQNDHIRFSWLGQEYIISSVLGAGEGIDMYDTQSPNLNFTNAFLTEFDGNDSSYNYPIAGERLAMMTVPGSVIGTDTLDYIANILVQNMDWLNTPHYLTDWDLSLVLNCDYYFRANLLDDWVHLNPLADTLAFDSAYLDPVFVYGDSTDYNGDGFVFAAQIKIVVYPLADTTVIDTVANAITEFIQPKILIKTTTDAFEFKTPNDNYVLTLYDMTGKVLFTDRFYGETYRFRTAELKSGMHIYTLESSTVNYTGKLYKP